MNVEAFFKLSYGLYIIATKDGNKLNGYIANTAFQVTAEPAKIAISCSKNNHTCSMIQKSQVFSISVLNKNAKTETIGIFGYQSGKDIDKLRNIKHTNAKTGAPIVLEDCIAWFDCKVNKMIDVGSHILFIATIKDNEILSKDAEPLTYAYYHAVKKGKAPKNAPTYIDESKFSKISKTDSPTNKKYKCLACGYIYDPAIGDGENGVDPGTAFEELPDDWVCPTCGSPKEMFEPI